MKDNQKKLLLVATASVLILVFVAGAMIYRQQESQRLESLAQANKAVFVRDHSPQMGKESAKVNIVEFLDPECEACRAAYPHVKQILDDYPDEVKLTVRYVPLHDNSEFAIRVLEAAREQGKYWEALHLLFLYQPEWGDHHRPNPGRILELLPQIFVDVSRLEEDMKDPRIADIIAQDVEDGRELAVRGTPTFFVNGTPAGMRELRGVVEREVDLHY